MTDLVSKWVNNQLVMVGNHKLVALVFNLGLFYHNLPLFVC